ncbi:YaiI/YqxD family protein [Bacillus alkalicellulosilyticus]|uniref:YaiI/YqxD family protein n=1 Tax=Alkalihalobacterium alkalicellulosilyticum TaxID=1912214 RepID=UPI000998A3AE|nr:YaiI/YqxD family protein [Bacillus alkalicellulosilyticus]
MAKKKRIYVDADSCPVKEEIIMISEEFEAEVIFVTSYSHWGIGSERTKTVLVDNQKEAVDMYIVNHVKANDIVVTQDYALASILLPRKSDVLSPRGVIYTEEKMNSLLEQRYVSQKQRRAGHKTKGPRKFTNEDRAMFCHSFRNFFKKEEGF